MYEYKVIIFLLQCTIPNFNDMYFQRQRSSTSSKKYCKLKKPATCHGKLNYAKFGVRSPYQKIVLCYCGRDEIYVKKEN